MAGASGGLIFINGLGAIFGPLITGWAMSTVGPAGFFWFTVILFVLIIAYGMFRMTQRSATAVEDTGSYVAVLPNAGAMAVEVAQDIAIEEAREEDQA